MARASQDVVGFRRIFVLYCTLVLVPAILMSGFAVIAIRNERQAEKTRVRESAQAQLQIAEAGFVSFVDDVDGRVRDAFTGKTDPAALRAAATRLRFQGVPLGPWVVQIPTSETLVGEAPVVIDGAVARTPRAIEVTTALRPGEVAHLNAAEIAPSLEGSVLAIQRFQGGGWIAFVLDEQQFSVGLTDQVRLESPFVFAHRILEKDEDVSPIGVLSRLVSEVIPASENGEANGDGSNVEVSAHEGLEEIVAARLKPPFDRSTLAVLAPPTGATVAIIYIILLLIFISVLITGVVITSRLIWQETKISRLKTDFVSHVSHELRTPLTSIRMFIETLRLGRAASKEEEQECLGMLTKETERLSEMIERVLGYARLQAGRRQFQVSPERVEDLVDDALNAFRAQILGEAGAAQLELSFDIPPDLPEVLADRTAMSEALLNLVGNAYKYTGPEKRIRVFAEPRRRRVVIGVEDNGPGLPKSEHARVFDRFYQAGNLLSRKSQGSGLGLAITRGIVEGQGGKIGVSSELGKGCTFYIELKTA